MFLVLLEDLDQSFVEFALLHCYNVLIRATDLRTHFHIVKNLPATGRRCGAAVSPYITVFEVVLVRPHIDAAPHS